MDLNRVVSFSLRVGVVTGSLVGVLGLVLWGLQGFGQAQPANGVGVFETLLSAFRGSVAGVVYLGVIVLVATPVFRVLVSAVFFWTQKDAKYLVITLLVFGMILLGIAVQAVLRADSPTAIRTAW